MAKIQRIGKKSSPKMVFFTMASSKFGNRNGKYEFSKNLKIDSNTAKQKLKSYVNVSEEEISVLTRIIIYYIMIIIIIIYCNF